MSDISPEINCNHDHIEKVNPCLERCIDCGTRWRAVMTSPDDFDWEEVEP